MAFEELKQRQAAAWGGSAPFEHIASQPGERWLDVATGTGAVAMRAARCGRRGEEAVSEGRRRRGAG